MTPSRNLRTMARGLLYLQRRRMLPRTPSSSRKSPSRSGGNRTYLPQSPPPLSNPEIRSSTKGHRTLKLGYKRGISETDTQRTVDLAAVTQPIIDPPTLTLAKDAAASSEAIHTNLLTIETGSLAAHNGLLIAETTIRHGLPPRIDPARLPLSTVCHHAQTSLRMTRGDRPGTGEETIILVISPVIGTTVQMTYRHFVTTVPKEIHGDRHTSTDHGLLRPLCLDLLEWIMLQRLPVLPMTRHTVSIPLHRHPQIRRHPPLPSDPCPQSICRYPSPSLQRNR